MSISYMPFRAQAADDAPAILFLMVYFLLLLHCKENWKQQFPEKELCNHIPHVGYELPHQ
jgi:hypothetical protein